MPSQFNGKRINPPNNPEKRKYVPALEEEKAFALALHNGKLHGEYSVIARRCVREFGIQRTRTTIRTWILKAEAE